MSSAPVLCNLVVLRSRDLDRAESFYRALGLTFIRHAHGNGPVHLASEAAGQTFEIYPLAVDAHSTAATRIGFAVPSADRAYTALLSVGGNSVSAPADSEWGRRAVVADPDGHRVELTTRAKEAEGS